MSWRDLIKDCLYLLKSVSIAQWITAVTLILGLVTALMRLFRQRRVQRSGRRAYVSQGATWRGEPAIIVHGWIEIDGTYTPNKNLSREMQEAKKKWLRN